MGAPPLSNFIVWWQPFCGQRKFSKLAFLSNDSINIESLCWPHITCVLLLVNECRIVGHFERKQRNSRRIQVIRGAGDFHFCELMKHQQSNGPDGTVLGRPTVHDVLASVFYCFDYPLRSIKPHSRLVNGCQFPKIVFFDFS